MTKEPSLSELRLRKLDHEIKAYEPGIRSKARKFEIKGADTMDIWKLVGLVHKREDELKLPRLQRQAEKLGVKTKGKDYTELYNDVWEERERQQLLRKFGGKV